MKDLTDALERLVLGSERRILMSSEERRRTAVHEAGHAIVGMLTPGADPVRKVSIIPHGKTLGVILSAPAADRFSYHAEYLKAKVDVTLAGHTAESLVYGGVSTGAENDLRQATELARHMVGSWGMSDAIGPMAILADPDQAIAFPASRETSDDTQRLLDSEVRRILKGARERVATLLSTHRDALDRLAQALIDQESLDDAAVREAAGFGGDRLPAPETVLGPLSVSRLGRDALVSLRVPDVRGGRRRTRCGSAEDDHDSLSRCARSCATDAATFGSADHPSYRSSRGEPRPIA
jgi:cell division protease FtsH